MARLDPAIARSIRGSNPRMTVIYRPYSGLINRPLLTFPGRGGPPSPPLVADGSDEHRGVVAQIRRRSRGWNRDAGAGAAEPIELAIVVPTLNERDNVPLIVERLNRTLDGIAWEVIFVDDDSPDGTADAVRALARGQGNIRCVQRIGRRGLQLGLHRRHAVERRAVSHSDGRRSAA